MHDSSGLSQGSWSVVEAMLRTAGEEDMHRLFSSTEKQYFSNCSEMQTRRGLLCEVYCVMFPGFKVIFVTKASYHL